MTDNGSTHGFGIVLGEPARLEAAVLARIAAVRARDPLAPIDVLVGGVLLRPYLQRLVAESTPGLVNVRMTTLGELGLRLGEPTLAASRRRPLPAIAERALAAEVARGATGYFAPVAATPGFADAARRVLRELRQEAVDPDELARHGDALESPAKADDIVSLYRRYLHARAGHYDGEDALAAADPRLFDGAELLVVGVWRLGATARRLVERLAERARVTVFLPALGPDEPHAALRAWLATHGAEETTLDPSPRSTCLDHLKGLFTGAGAPPDGTVRLVSAPDPLAETREAARVCLDWAGEGIAFRDMAVSYRQAELYRPLIEAVFTEAGIPLYLDEGPALSERPLGRRILALLDLLGSPLRRRDVMAFLSDGWMPKETRERFGGAPRARWDSISRRAGVVEGIGQWRERLGLALAHDEERLAQEDAPDWRARRVEDTRHLIAFMEEIAERLSARPPGPGWGASLDVLLPILRDYAEDCESVVGYLEQLRDLDRVVPGVDFDRVLDAVRAEVRSLRAGDLDEGQQGAFGRRGVNVLDVNQLRNLRFRAVAVLGLTERAFPPPPRQDPLLLDAERGRLNAAGGWDLPLRAQGPDPEPLQFALAVHAARERLHLSTRRAEESGGRAQIPSAFFRLAVSVIAGRRVRVEEVADLDVVRRMPAGRVGAGDADRSLTPEERDRTLIETRPVLGRAVLERLEPRALRADSLRRARWGERSLTPFDGVFDNTAALHLLATALDDGTLHATGLEGYATCPFRYLLASVLRVKPVVEPERLLQIEPMTRGSAVHRTLQRFMEASRPQAGDAQQVLHRIAEEELDAVEAQGLTGTPLLWRADRQEILDDLVVWLERERTSARRELVGTEVSFGRAAADLRPPATEDPLVVEIPGRTLRFAGSIDRLDREPAGGFRVVDYKTGSGWGLPTSGGLNGGRSLQLPLYVLAGAMILDVDASQGQAAYEVVSRRGNFKQINFSAEDLAERHDDFQHVLGRIADGITTGDFHHEPGDACRYCDYADLCDVGRERIKARKADDPRAQSFSAMREIP